MSNNGEKRAMHEAVYSALLDDPGHRHASCDEHTIYGDPQFVDADVPTDLKDIPAAWTYKHPRHR